MAQIAYALVKIVRSFERVECRDQVVEFEEAYKISTESRRGARVGVDGDEIRIGSFGFPGVTAAELFLVFLPQMVHGVRTCNRRLPIIQDAHNAPGLSKGRGVTPSNLLLRRGGQCWFDQPLSHLPSVAKCPSSTNHYLDGRPLTRLNCTQPESRDDVTCRT